MGADHIAKPGPRPCQALVPTSRVLGSERVRSCQPSIKSRGSQRLRPGVSPTTPRTIKRFGRPYTSTPMMPYDDPQITHLPANAMYGNRAAGGVGVS